MFGIFENNSEVAEAKIFFGSTEESNENVQERKSPFDDAVVSRVPLCNADDTIKALHIAKEAAKDAAKTPLSQRILWL
jgi:acyl-CoA reductase-like NAD-dependent aldehyde dehydrogenase